MVLNWSHLNLRCHSFDFHLSNAVVAVNLFVIVVAAAAAVVFPVFVSLGKDIQD